VALFGVDTARWLSGRWLAARRRAQLLVQDPRAMLHPRFPLGLLLEESARLHRPGDDPRREADRVLAEVGLAAARDARVSTLSGGERRRAGIARILLARPGLVVADEPTSGLDAALKADILELLDRALGPECALVVITHDLASIAMFARRTLVMADGRIAEELAPGVAPQHAATHRLLAAAGLPREWAGPITASAAR
jgi:peptide/nickel transport system ATP-binding protein